jgi:hypothetical protein
VKGLPNFAEAGRMTPVNQEKKWSNQDGNRFRVTSKMRNVPDFAAWESFEAGFDHLWQIAKNSSQAEAAGYAMGH